MLKRFLFGKRKVIYSISIIGFLIVLIGSSYAFYNYTLSGKSTTVEAGILSLNLTSTSETGLDLQTEKPISDERGKLKEAIYTFTVSGYITGNLPIIYDLIAKNGDEIEGKTRFRDSDIKLYLTDANDKELSLSTGSNLDTTGTTLYTSNIIGGTSESLVTHTYKLRMWLSDTILITNKTVPEGKSGYTMEEFNNSYFSIKIELNSKGVGIIDANAPSLEEGMIPIKYDETSHNWVKADNSNTNNDWYNYNKKIWANVALVTESSRANYLSSNTSVGTPITESDILAYFVWIPRYKYKLFNVSTDTEVTPQEIYIVFEMDSGTTGAGSIVGEYLTHPAFTFGEDNLTGIWVAKFETSSSTLDAISTTCLNSASDGNCNNTNILPSILPNVNSLRYQQVANQYITSLKFAGGTLTDGIVEFAGNTTYGLTQNTDSHMMKNTEWGAVAYLSHSKYGINEEIAINDSGYITGRSNGSNKIPAPGSAQGSYKYDDIKVYQDVSVVSGGTTVTPTITQEETYPWTFQDGYYKSGNYNITSTTSTMTVNFTIDTTGVLSFDYGVSSRSYSDYLYYTISDGITTTGSVALNGISGNFYGTTEGNLAYYHQTIALEAGSYTVSFIYRKTSSRMGLDRGFVKNITIETGTVTTTNELIEGISGTNSSTTGNIYGIYDMSGGAWEYVMGVMEDTNDPTLPRSGYTGRNYTVEEALASGLNSGTAYTGLNINSGFNGMLYGKDYDEGTSTWVTMYKEDGVNFPNNKYYNLYGNTSSRILGDATREIAGWYGDFQSWVLATYPWFLRGGYYFGGASAGAFRFDYYNGLAYGGYSFRVVLVC